MKIRHLIALSCLLAGCVQAEVVRLGTAAPLPAVAPSLVAVFRTPPQQPFAEVAMVSVKGWKSISANELLAALKKEAAAIGANAIILETMDEQRVKGATVVGGFIVLHKDRVARALAVRLP